MEENLRQTVIRKQEAAESDEAIENGEEMEEMREKMIELNHLINVQERAIESMQDVGERQLEQQRLLEEEEKEKKERGRSRVRKMLPSSPFSSPFLSPSPVHRATSSSFDSRSSSPLLRLQSVPSSPLQPSVRSTRSTGSSGPGMESSEEALADTKIDENSPIGQIESSISDVCMRREETEILLEVSQQDVSF